MSTEYVSRLNMQFYCKINISITHGIYFPKKVHSDFGNQILGI